MTRWKELEHIANASRGYAADEFELYRAEAGWEDWMENYTESAEGEPISESEARQIEAVQREGFKMSHSI